MKKSLLNQKPLARLSGKCRAEGRFRRKILPLCLLGCLGGYVTTRFKDGTPREMDIRFPETVRSGHAQRVPAPRPFRADPDARFLWQNASGERTAGELFPGAGTSADFRDASPAVAAWPVPGAPAGTPWPAAGSRDFFPRQSPGRLVGGGRNAPASTLGADGLATQGEINSLRSGLEMTLTALEQNLIAQVFGDSLPLVGDHLSGVAEQGLDALHQLTGLKAALTAGLNALTGSATYTRQQVEQAVSTGLANASITHSGVTLDASNPTDIKLSMNTTRVFAAVTTPLDAGLGIPGLGLHTSGDARTALTYTLNYSVGVDNEGFYFRTGASTSLGVGIIVTIPNLDVSAELSRLRFRLTDESGTDGDLIPPSTFSGGFALTILDPGGDGKLRISELGADLLDVKLSGTSALNLNLASDLGDANFPAISADLNFSWNFDSAPVTVGDTNINFGARPTMAFRNVTLDAGKFFSRFARPVLEKVREVSEPVQPIVRAIVEPIPLLSSLNEITSYVPRSLLDMAVANGTITQEQADRFDVLAKVIEISNALPPDGTVANVKIDLGDFDLGTADPRAVDFNIAGITPNKIRTAVEAALQDPTVQHFVEQIAGFPKEDLPVGESKGIQFPILQTPEVAFGLLLGKDVDLFVMDNATQNLSLYDIDEFVRLVGPVGFRFKGMGDVRLDFDFGFDTKGLTDFAGSGNPLDIFHGFYALVPLDQRGDPKAMAELNADMHASVAANIFLAEVGAGGNLTADVRATLADPDSDGRVHLDEFIDQFGVSPLCILQADGALNFGLQAYVTLGYSFLSRTIDYEFPVGTVIDFSHACGDSPDPVFARIDAGDAKLHIGPEAGMRQVGNRIDTAEAFTVAHQSGNPGAEQIQVSFTPNGAAGGFGALPYGPVNGVIRGDGGADNDIIKLAPDVLTPAILSGNGGMDRLTGGEGNDRLSGGEDRDFLTGNGGNDTLLGEDGNDVLEGGPGADVLDGGPGTDAVSFAHSTAPVTINLTTGQHTNDAAGDTFTAIELFEGTPFGDSLTGSGNSDIFFGLAGNDTLDGGPGDDGLEGGPGADHLIGGPGQDFTTYFFSPAGVNVNLATGVATGGDAEGDFLETIENLVGSEFNDTLTGNDADNQIGGVGGDDIIITGSGNNTVQGGEGKDTITGGPGNDTLYGEGPDTPVFETSEHPDDPKGILYGLQQQDTIDGGEGDNYIEGGWGIDTITSGGGKDRIFGGNSGDLISSGDGDDYIEGGTGRDTIDAGPGDDYVKVIQTVSLPPDPNLPFPLNLPYPRFEGNTLVGMGGDTLQGGPGIDTIDLRDMMCRGYYSLTQSNVFGVVVNLATGAVANGAQECTIQGFENIIGTDAGDDLTGTGGPNVFQPLRGGGLFTHATGGPDRIDGGGGVDTLIIDFSLANPPEPNGVTTNGSTLSRLAAGGSRGDGYIFASIERLQLTGADKNDQFYGYVVGGNDILIGNGGADFLGGNSGSDVLRGGEGNDTLTALGQYNLASYGTVDGHDILDGGPGDDTIEEIAYQFGTGAPMIAPDATFQIDGGEGFDKVSVNVSNHTGPIVWDSATPTDLELSNGSYVRNFEQIMRLVTGDGNDDITQRGRIDNTFNLGGGDDVLRPGLGTDYVNGGGGRDLLILDYSQDDLPEYGGVYYNDAYRRDRIVAPVTGVDYIYIREFERFQITGTSKADSLFGGDDDDILTGLGGNDTLTGYGGGDTIDGGEGDDTIRQRNPFVADSTISGGPGADKVYMEFGGPPSQGYGSDTITLGDGNDEMQALWYDVNFGRTYAANGQIQRYDGGPGYDNGSADFGNQSMSIDFVEGADNSFDFPDGSYFRHFEACRYFTSGTGNDRFTFKGRATVDLACGGGNDWVDMGLGSDKVFGGPGEDTLVVDWSIGDDAELGGIYFNGYAMGRNNLSTNAVVDFIYPPEFEHIYFTGGSKGDVLVATNGSDILKGMRGNDQLRSYDGADLLLGCDPLHGRGAGEIDQLTGDGGADVFVLGDVSGRFYDDGNQATPGQEDYAKITDFNPAQDRLKLYGSPSSYLLGPSPIAGVSGTALFHDSNGNSVLDATDELIATLGTATLTAANTLTPADPVTPPTIDSTGVADLASVSTGSGSARIPGLTFSMVSNLRPGETLEVLASADLGGLDPWRVVAGKTGDSVWYGPASATASPPAAGKVSVTVTEPQWPAVSARFYKIQVRSF